MLIGRRFRFRNPTLALDCVQEKPVPTTIPAGSVVVVVGGVHDVDRLVDVAWAGRVLTMFVLDVKVRGVEITDQDAMLAHRNLLGSA